jgi:uncharacterized protein YciI
MKNIFVITVTFKAPMSEVEKYMEAHRGFLDDALKSGVLMMSGGRNPKVGGVIVCKFWSMDEAQAFIHQDPLCVADVADYDVVEFSPSRCADEIKDFMCQK